MRNLTILPDRAAGLWQAAIACAAAPASHLTDDSPSRRAAAPASHLTDDSPSHRGAVPASHPADDRPPYRGATSDGFNKGPAKPGI